MSNKKIVCVIPARLNSTRLPKKILCTLLGKPLLQWVFESASKVKLFDSVVIAIDSEETEKVVKSFNAPYVMTSPECKSGTERLVEVSKKHNIEADIWVNWQGDEPFITPTMIDELLQTSHRDDVDVWTLKKFIVNEEDVYSSNVAKVTCNARGDAMYFSRSPIPFYRDKISFKEKKYFKHVGIYAYTKECLKKISDMPYCYLEDAEHLEQLSFLYNGLKIKVHETTTQVFGIDTLDDLIKAEQYALK